MRHAFLYSYDPQNGLQTQAVVVSDLRDINRMMEVARSKGLDETSAQMREVIAAYVGYPPHMDLVHQWAEAADRAALEAEHPWLAFYRGEAVALPEDDPGLRQAEVDQLVAEFYRRVFKAERAERLRAIKVTVDGKQLDGDETAQTRMARVVTIAQHQLLNGLIDYLETQQGNTALTTPELVSGLLTAFNQIRQDQSAQWMLSDNSASTFTPSQLCEGLHLAMREQESLWGFDS
ncbi:hypothetical protein [Microbulbifer discodermiae]|uniref:hypothetical protein n=1 Tax=Microbulbifer sp. 2201CG32-9 TaxID=3232309 RepID=UPI00345B7D74